MSTSREKLADSLTLLNAAQAERRVAVRSDELSRVHKERLQKSGFLKRVIKGWYRSSRPDAYDFDDSGWLIVYWQFMAEYLEYRFQRNWCLAPEQSLLLFSGRNVVPNQLIVRANSASNNITRFPCDTSLYEVKARVANVDEVLLLDGLRLFRPEVALSIVRQDFFKMHPTDTKAILRSNLNEELLIENLQNANRSRLADSLAIMFARTGQFETAEKIRDTLKIKKTSVHDIGDCDQKDSRYTSLPTSPYASRINALWDDMKEKISAKRILIRPKPSDVKSYLHSIEEVYVKDAYHSLSIEGYQVTEKLINAIREGVWPSKYELQHVKDQNALAAVGYRRAFEQVKITVKEVMNGKNPGKAVCDDIHGWYQALFSSYVEAEILTEASLMGFRDTKVFIRGSRHVPMNSGALRDCMEVFYELLEYENDPFIRTVLGHFFFVYIHPYFDGNGRIARFIMNVMLAATGVPWITIEFSQRNHYFNALDKASVDGDILPFANFLLDAVQNSIQRQCTD